MGLGVLEAGVDPSPPSLSEMARVPYYPGKWVQMWDMTLSWANNPGLVIHSLRLQWVSPPTHTKALPILVHKGHLDPSEGDLVK